MNNQQIYHLIDSIKSELSIIDFAKKQIEKHLIRIIKDIKDERIRNEEGESAFLLECPKTCIPIVKEFNDGTIIESKYCPTGVLIRGLSDKEQNLINSDLDKDEIIVYSEKEGYKKVKDATQIHLYKEHFDNKELFIETCSHPESVMSPEELDDFLKKQRVLDHKRFLDKNATK